jgi:hypothetical protein
MLGRRRSRRRIRTPRAYESPRVHVPEFRVALAQGEHFLLEVLEDRAVRVCVKVKSNVRTQVSVLVW